MNLYVAITCLLAFTVSINAKANGELGLGDLQGLVYAPGHASADYYSYPRYAFDYAVNDPHTGDNKAQWEKRDGDVVKGAYSLVEPDGSVRVVEYWADDKSGFNAVVKRIGPNLHPTGPPATPIYKAPIPVLSSGPIGHIAPISIGSIAKYEGLASAPLISGPVLSGAVASSSYNSAPIVKPVAPAHILSEPYLQAPIYKSAPIVHPLPILPAPVKSAPYGPLQYLPGPIYKSGAILSGPIEQGWSGGLSKSPIAAPLDFGYGKDLGYGPNKGLGYGLNKDFGYYGLNNGLLSLPLGDIGYGLNKDLGYGLNKDLGYGLNKDLGYGINNGIWGASLGELGHRLLEKGPQWAPLPYGKY